MSPGHHVRAATERMDIGHHHEFRGCGFGGGPASIAFTRRHGNRTDPSVRSNARRRERWARTGRSYSSRSAVAGRAPLNGRLKCRRCAFRSGLPGSVYSGLSSSLDGARLLVQFLASCSGGDFGRTGGFPQRRHAPLAGRRGTAASASRQRPSSLPKRNAASRSRLSLIEPPHSRRRLESVSSALIQPAASPWRQKGCRTPTYGRA